MQQFVSPKVASMALGVSESSLKRWSDRGLVPLTKTAGGHRRVLVAGLVQFARAHGHAILRPEVLGLPATAGRGPLVLSASELSQLLLAGDELAVRRAILAAYLGGQRIAAIVDGAIAPAFRQIGECWANGTAHVHHEHRASEIVLGVLRELRLLIPDPPADAPLALGATLEGDYYSLALSSAELVLREAGFAAVNLGSNLPGRDLARAIAELTPRLVFVSVSAVADESSFAATIDEVFRAASAGGALLVIGGSALTESLVGRIRFGARLDTMARLADLGPCVY